MGRSSSSVWSVGIVHKEWVLGYCLILIFDCLMPLTDTQMYLPNAISVSGVTVAYIVACLIAVIFPAKVSTACNDRRFSGILAIATAILSAVCSFGGAMHILPVTVMAISAIFSGMFLGMFTLRFFQTISRFAVTSVIIMLTICHVVSPAIALLVSIIPFDAIRMAIVAILPVGAWIAIAGRGSASEDDDALSEMHREGSGKSATIPVRPIILMMIVAFADAFPRGLILEAQQAISFSGVLVSALVVWLVMGLSGKVIRFKILYQASMLLLIGGLFVLGLDTRISTIISSAVMNGGYVLFLIFLDAILCNHCRRGNIDSYRLFGMVNACVSASFTIGDIAGAGYLADSSPNITLVAFLIAIVLVLAFTIFLTDKDYRTSWETSKDEKGRPSIADFYYSFPDVCSAIAQQYGLTRREEEILILLAQRKTVGDIESELFIAPSTIKTHCKSIYRKLDIHKRSELLKMVGHPVSFKDEDGAGSGRFPH